MVHRRVINSVVMWLHILVGPRCCVYVALVGSKKGHNMFRSVIQPSSG